MSSRKNLAIKEIKEQRYDRKKEFIFGGAAAQRGPWPPHS